MFSKVYVCPHCGRSENVVRHGFTRAGSQRLRCNVCKKAWAPEAKSRALSREKEALIEKALSERLSQRAIARSLGAGRVTVARILKKNLKKHA